MNFQTAIERNQEMIPVGELGIIPLKSSETLGKKIDQYIVQWRQDRVHAHQESPLLQNYAKQSFVLE